MKKLNWKLLLAEGLTLFLAARQQRRTPLARFGRRQKLLDRGLSALTKRLRKSGGRVRY